MLEDKRLVWQLRRGSRDALRVIYDKYRDDLLRIAAGLLKERTQAEDAVHEAFISLAERPRDFTLTGTLKGYLAVCVANKARNINRTAHHQRIVPLDELALPPSGARRPDQWIIEDEQFRRLCDAMARLPYEQREAVILHLQGSMKFRQIAQLQDVSVQTVQSRYRYGLTKLRSLLNGEVTK